MENLGLADEETQVVSFKGRGLKLVTEEDAMEIVDALGNTSRAVSLVLEGNTIGPDAAGAIGLALKAHPEFERAKWSDMFTGKLKTEIPPALKRLSAGVIGAGASLRELDLSDNAFGALGVEGVLELLQSSSCYSLEELRLNNNGLGISGGQLLAKTLLECHESGLKVGRPLRLKVFVSGRNRLENEGATALAATFETLGSLEFVSMPQNGINHPGITALARAFKSNKNLQSINLSDNTFTKTGAKAFAEALPEMNELESINFESCLIRTSGASVLAESIRTCVPKLKELNLQFNEINPEGGITVAKSLASKSLITNVYLGGNQFGQGMARVTAAMKAAGKADMLGSLSEDEGTDDEEDDEEEEEEESESEKVDPATFFGSPSENSLAGLNMEDVSTYFKDRCSSCSSSYERINQALIYFMKIASLVQKSTSEKIMKQAFEASDLLFDAMVNGENDQSLLTNCVLVHFGLMKSEEKRFQPVTTELYGALVLLNHAVEKRRFPKSCTSIFTFFFSKSNERLDSNFEKKSILLKTIYRI